MANGNDVPKEAFTIKTQQRLINLGKITAVNAILRDAYLGDERPPEDRSNFVEARKLLTRLEESLRMNS